MRKTIPQMKFMIQSSIVILTTMLMLFLEVQGIRHRTMISSVSLEHKTASISIVPWTSSTGGVKYSGDPAIKAEKMIVVRRRTRSSTLSSGVAAGSEKKPQQHQHHHHWMPSIHEDYFGPRHHKPTHH